MVKFFLFCEERCFAIADKHFPRLGSIARRYNRVLKYISAGGTAAAIDLGALYVLTDFAGFHYLFSATTAFLLAFGVSFTLQKFWTFGDKSLERIHAQLTLYLTIAVANIFVNVGLMYLFVDIFGVWYLLAQIIAGAIMACYGFLLYRYVIFRKETHESTHHNPEG